MPLSSVGARSPDLKSTGHSKRRKSVRPIGGPAAVMGEAIDPARNAAKVARFQRGIEFCAMLDGSEQARPVFVELGRRSLTEF